MFHLTPTNGSNMSRWNDFIYLHLQAVTTLDGILRGGTQK
jgi:hypothetical protein